MASAATVEAEDVVITQRLYRRRSRAAALESELAAHRELSALMAVDPQRAIQRFLDLAIELCPSAGSAGLSELVEPAQGEAYFEWTAMSGALAQYVGGSTPREFSPCGLCLDQHHTILVERPGRVFTYFNDAQPEILEGLIVPLYDTGKRPIGTLWVTSHKAGCKFDPTDARVMEQLAIQLVLAIKLRRKARILLQLEQAAHDKEVLIHEVRHRVKNMIQMTSSLLHLQANAVQSKEAKGALEEAESRLHVIANVYQTLLQPSADDREVDAAALISGVAAALHQTSPNSKLIDLHSSCDELMLDVADAVPLGLIVNEAITNCLKHAFEPGQRGQIALELQVDGPKCRVAVMDNGVGIKGQPRSGSLGMRLMKSLARQLKGELTMDGHGGASVALTWKLPSGSQQRTPAERHHKWGADPEVSAR